MTVVERDGSGLHRARDKSTIKRLQMYTKGGKAIRSVVRNMLSYDECCVCRNKHGQVTRPAPFQSSVKSGQVARVEPNKKWFGEY